MKNTLFLIDSLMKEQKLLFTVFTDEVNKLLSEGWRITHISAIINSVNRGCYVVIERTKFMNGNENNLPNITEDKPLVY